MSVRAQFCRLRKKVRLSPVIGKSIPQGLNRLRKKLALGTKPQGFVSGHDRGTLWVVGPQMSQNERGL